MDVPAVAGLDGAWLEPAGSPTAARRIGLCGGSEATDVWAHPFRIACGVTTTGAVYCVGNNLYGQMGDATNENRTVLVKGAYQP